MLVSHTPRLSRPLKKLLKSRQAIEPAIGRMKNDRLLDRNWLKGGLGDAMHALRCGAGHHLRMTLARLPVLCSAFVGQITMALMLLTGAISPQNASARA